MIPKVWRLVSPFKGAFVAFFFLAIVYESARMAETYLISLVVRMFESKVDGSVWFVLLAGAMVFDEMFMRLDNVYDWHIITRHSHPIYRQLKLEAVKKFLRIDLTWHHQNNSGSLVGKVSDGVWKVLEIVDTMSWEFVPTLIQAVISLVPLLILCPWVALIAVVVLLIFLILSVMANRAKQPFRSERHDRYSDEWQAAIEAVQSVETTMCFGQQERLIAYQENLHDEIIRLAKEEHRLGVFRYNRWRIRAMSIAKRLIWMIWIWQLSSGTLDVANLIFVNSLIERLFGSFWRFARLLDRFAESSEGATRLSDLMSAPEKVESGSDQIVPESALGVELVDVCFGYGLDYSEEEGALHNLSLSVPPGSIVALVGPSGAGKTTIRKVITRLVDCQRGCVKVAGIDIRDWTAKQLLSLFSYVPQGDDVYIFDASIRDNIAFPRFQASDEEVVRAASLAGIDSFICSLKEGYKTKVGERGVRLSGGQKQRVALARAILADRKILILDEATSAVDAITERDIQANMGTILAGKTAIIVAHRLSTVWDLADKIVVMDQGRIVEEGSHAELMAKNGLYAKMVALQTV